MLSPAVRSAIVADEAERTRKAVASHVRPTTRLTHAWGKIERRADVYFPT